MARSTARDLGLLVLAAGGTLLVLAAYEVWQRISRSPATSPTAAQAKRAPQAATPASQRATPAQPAKSGDSTIPPDAAAAAHAALGPDGEVLAYGDFPATGGRQIVVVQRVPSGTAQPAPRPANTAPQELETAVEVVRVSILVTDGQTWKEAFRADEHLKNRHGFLQGAPAEPVSAWFLTCSKTPEDGFRLLFTPANLPSGRKPVAVSVGWNSKREEYDALNASGKGFLATAPTPGNAPIPIKP